MPSNDYQAETEYAQTPQDGGCQGGCQLGQEAMGDHVRKEVAQGDNGTVSPQGVQEEGVARDC